MRTLILFLLLSSSLQAIEKNKYFVITPYLEKITRNQNEELYQYKVKVVNLWKIKEIDLKIEKTHSCGIEPEEASGVIDKKGKILIDQGFGLEFLEEMTFTLRNFSDGEMSIHRISDKKNEVLAEFTITPKPLQCIGNDGARVNLILRSPGIYEMKGEGFRPFEKIKIISKSNNETLQSYLQLTNDGKFEGRITPATIGSLFGDAQLMIIRDNSSELLIKYHWFTAL